MKPEADHVQPIPPRYWWLKRLLLAAPSLVLVLAVVWVAWYHLARRALQTEVDKLVAAGEPVQKSDFAGLSVPDSENAYLLLDAAASKLNSMPASDKKLLNGLRSSLPRIDQPQEAERLNRVVSEVRTLVHRACRVERIAWPFGNARWFRFADFDEILALDVVLARRAGREEAAMASIRDLLRLSRHFDRARLPLGNIVGFGFQKTAIQYLEWVLPDLAAVHTAEDTANYRVSRGQIASLIGELSDDRTAREGFLNTVRYMRAMVIDDLAGAGRSGAAEYVNSGWKMGWGVVTLPSFLSQSRDEIRRWNQSVEASRAADYPAAVRLIQFNSSGQASPQIRSTLQFVSKLLLLCSWQDRGSADYLKWHWQVIMARRRAAIALAVRLYQLDHGRFPAQLGELVPAYLPSIPSDPTASEPRPFTYEPAEAYPCLRAADGSKFYLKGRPPEPAKKGTRPATTRPGTSASN